MKPCRSATLKPKPPELSSVQEFRIIRIEVHHNSEHDLIIRGNLIIRGKSLDDQLESLPIIANLCHLSQALSKWLILFFFSVVNMVND